MKPIQLSDLKESLSLNIKARRKELGISQEKLALLCALDRSYMSEIERQLANPTIETLVRLGNALQTSPSDLLRTGSIEEFRS
jgi:transcriptional regulator with XRE-family HTH domain